MMGDLISEVGWRLFRRGALGVVNIRTEAQPHLKDTHAFDIEAPMDTERELQNKTDVLLGIHT